VNGDFLINTIKNYFIFVNANNAATLTDALFVTLTHLKVNALNFTVVWNIFSNGSGPSITTSSICFKTSEASILALTKVKHSYLNACKISKVILTKCLVHERGHNRSASSNRKF
jgi:hypothetical protein